MVLDHLKNKNWLIPMTDFYFFFRRENNLLEKSFCGEANAFEKYASSTCVISIKIVAMLCVFYEKYLEIKVFEFGRVK